MEGLVKLSASIEGGEREEGGKGALGEWHKIQLDFCLEGEGKRRPRQSRTRFVRRFPQTRSRLALDYPLLCRVCSMVASRVCIESCVLNEVCGRTNLYVIG